MKPQRVFASIALFLLGFMLSAICIMASLMILLLLFDNKGGEPGSRIIFGSALFWPVFLILMIGGGYAQATNGPHRKFLPITTGVLVSTAAILNIVNLVIGL